MAEVKIFHIKGRRYRKEWKAKKSVNVYVSLNKYWVFKIIIISYLFIIHIELKYTVIMPFKLSNALTFFAKDGKNTN